MKRPRGAALQHMHRFLGIAVVGAQVLGVRPVVDHLVVVPLEECRAKRVHRLHMFVHQIVFPLTPELGQRFGHLALFLDQGGVLPDHRAVLFDLVLHRAIGIDRIAGMDEEIGPMLSHGGIGAHTLVVDTPTLTGGIARPRKPNVAPRGRCCTEAADDGLGHGADIVQVGGDKAIEYLLIGRQALDQPLDGKIALGCGEHRRQAARIGKALGARHFHHHFCRTVGAGPDHARCGIDVTGLHPMGKDRARGGAADRWHGQRRGKGGAACQKGPARGAKKSCHANALLSGGRSLRSARLVGA